MQFFVRGIIAVLILEKHLLHPHGKNTIHFMVSITQIINNSISPHTTDKIPEVYILWNSYAIPLPVEHRTQRTL